MKQYTKGRAGPVSRLTLEIRDVINIEDGPNSRARGDGVATMAGGKIRGVSFLVQGGNHAAVRDRMVQGETLDVSVRWTGGSAVTIIEYHPPVAKAA